MNQTPNYKHGQAHCMCVCVCVFVFKGGFCLLDNLLPEGESNGRKHPSSVGALVGPQF